MSGGGPDMVPTPLYPPPFLAPYLNPVYDWHEHRIDGRSTGVYEAVATPNDPVCFGSLTGELAEIPKVVIFGSVSFMDARVVDVRACAQCCESDGYCGPERRWN